MRQIRTAAIATLGCKLNQSESDQMARQLAGMGIEMVAFGQPADLCIINSCTVTHIGDRKSRHLVRQAILANPNAFVAVAGCYAEVSPEAVSGIEGVGAVIGNQSKSRLVEALCEQGLLLGAENWKGERAKDEATQNSELRTQNSLHLSVDPRTRAFVKIQEGCDNVCSYCIVPAARGEGRSLPAAEIIAEIRRLFSEGYQEAVLTGVNITAYGRDRGSDTERDAARGMGLVRLLEAILEQTEIPRVRLSSMQPEDWNPAYRELLSTGRVCRHLHLSLQSGSDGVLRRMRRRYNSRQYAAVVAEARSAAPNVAITTDVIVGFPGESDAEHAETEAFLRSIGLAGLHVFKYSPRKGTEAAQMAEQTDPKIKQLRSDKLIALGQEMSRGFRTRLRGSVLGVLWEEPLPATQARKLGMDPASGNITWSGLSDNYVRVYTQSPGTLHGTISGAHIGSIVGDGVIGMLVRS